MIIHMSRQQFVCRCAISVLCAVYTMASTCHADENLTGRPWIDMNYGPYLTASLEVTPGNIAYKGVAIRLDTGPGGISRGNQFVLFDTDTLRMAAGWSGSFIDWRSIVFDGSHQTHPQVAGSLWFENRVGPGWGNPQDGRFTDERLRGHDELPYGPLARDWAKWQGLYVHGDRVVLSYKVGAAAILESPSRESAGGVDVTARTLEIGPRSHELVLQAAHAAEGSFVLRDGTPPLAIGVGNKKKQDQKVASTGSEPYEFSGTHAADVAKSDQFNLTSADFTVYAKFKTKRGGTILAQAPPHGAEWAPNGKTFFVRDGRLCFDIGWVGAVTSRREVDDGKWHDAALVYDHKSGEAQLVIDGKADNAESLKPEGETGELAMRIGYTSPDFPEPTAFVGELAEVRFYQRKIPAAQLVNDRLPNDNLRAQWETNEKQNDGFVDRSGNGHDAKLVSVTAAATRQRVGNTVVALRGDTQQAKWLTVGHDLRLVIAPSADVTRLKLLYGAYEQNDDNSDDALLPFTRAAAASPPPEKLAPLTHGGPAAWTETVETKSNVLGEHDGAYVVETITTPLENPYRSWMRLGGFDFFSDPSRAAVCTWMGDMWTVDNVVGDKFLWKRIATGMFQPLGVRIIDDTIYVCCRDQITRLHDLNDDGTIDYYENFNNDHQVTEHFHEFAMDLQTDDEGNFYYAKSARHAKDSLVPHHGTLIKVSPDGAHSEIVCNGFRAANGVGIGPNGEIATSDQEGHWTPANRINLVKEGGFYGNMYSYHRGQRPTEFDPPVCWLPHNIDRSPAEQLWVTSDRWGPIEGKMVALSYGTGKAFLVNYEQVDGVYQGGAMRLPIATFPTGIMRGRFHPGDGQLYACGLFGWSSDRTRPGGFYRIRYTGVPLHLPVGLEIKEKGVEITFSHPLDEDEAGDPENYVVRQWNYRWTANYGSDHYSVARPNRKGEDEVYVEDVTVSDDKRTVFIELEETQPVMQMEIDFTIAAADGTDIRQTIYNTINVVPGPAEEDDDR